MAGAITKEICFRREILFCEIGHVRPSPLKKRYIKHFSSSPYSSFQRRLTICITVLPRKKFSRLLCQRKSIFRSGQPTPPPPHISYFFNTRPFSVEEEKWLYRSGSVKTDEEWMPIFFFLPHSSLGGSMHTPQATGLYLQVYCKVWFTFYL